MAIQPKTKADLDKLGSALARLAEEDPTLRVHRHPDTFETLMEGLGEWQNRPTDPGLPALTIHPTPSETVAMR